MAPFVNAARTLDGQLHAAAAAINATGPPWPRIAPNVSAAVQAADLAPVAKAIPPGLPTALLQGSILVYSDLASRRDAMRWFGTAAGAPYDEPEAEAVLLRSLGNGTAAAARFAADINGFEALAAASKPVIVAAPTSRAAAELALLVDFVNGENAGCASTGGQIVTSLPTITWTRHGQFDGWIGGISFVARLVNGSWDTSIWAC